MRKPWKIALWCLGILLLLPALAIAGVFLALNTDPGRRFAERQIAGLTSGAVVVDGLDGRFPDRIRLGHVELRDKDGAWLSADKLALDWSPLALIHKQVLVERFDVELLQVPRLAASEPAPAKPAQPSEPFSLPVHVTVQQFAIARAEIGAPVIGKDAALSLAGRADAESLDAATAALTAKRLPVPADGPPQPGDYALNAQLTPQGIDANLSVREPPKGLIATLASLPDIGPLRIDGGVNGPRSALATKLDLAAGPLTVSADGTVNLEGKTLALNVAAQAPAMQPAPNVSWRAIALNAHVAGPFETPDATGKLRLDGLQAGGAAIRNLTADLAGDKGKVDLQAALTGLRIPGPKPGLFEADPLTLDVKIQLDKPGRPAAFVVAHPLIDLKGAAVTAGNPVVDAVLALPDLKPLAAAGGQDIAGRATLNLHATQVADLIAADVKGDLAVTGGMAPAPALIGSDAKIDIAVRKAGEDIAIDRFTLDGAAINLAVNGDYKPAGIDVAAKLGLADLALVTPTLEGDAHLDAHAFGPLADFALDLALAGDIGTKQITRAPVRLTANLTGLPDLPTGRVVGSGTLAGAPLDLALDANRSADGALHATIKRTEWRSLHASGAFTLPQGATLPEGGLDLAFGDLADLRPLIGQPVSGAIAAKVASNPGEVTLDVTAKNAGLPGQRIGSASVKAHVADPLGAPAVKATVIVGGIDANGVTGALRVDADGPQSALKIKAAADVNASGTRAKVAAAALLDATAKRVRLETLQVVADNASIKPQTVRLLAPATIDYGDGVAVDRLRIGLQQAVLNVAGRFSPSLDATVKLRTPADIASIVAPEYPLDGDIDLDARLTGTPAKPGGAVKLAARNIHVRSGPGASLPPANLAANVDLRGASAGVDVRLNAGSANLTVNGTAPIGAGPLDLRARGGLDLALTDPILTAAGRRLRGQAALDATVTGTAAKPEAAGSVRLSNGEFQDFTQGVRLNDMTALVRLRGQSVDIESFKARAGDGTINVSGSVGALEPTIPVDLAITMDNARPIASDLITAYLDSNLKVGGAVKTGLNLGGDILIRKAEIGIPSTLPASVVSLDVTRPGDKPPESSEPSAPIDLDLTIRAPDAIFVRGRGLTAELAGDLRIRGASAKPQVTGGLDMRRGSLDIAGTTLVFDTGRVGFDGTGVSGKIDPTINFVANSNAGGITATLEITGYASDPKIKLTSTPALPQDEVLAYLIFNRSAKELGPLQIAEIAAGLAQLSGATGSGGGPLSGIRKGLGLDRLSVGGGSGSNSSPTLEAGRYVANGVYVGAKQGTAGTADTQAQVQIDILKGLKLESDVGAGRGGNEVGLTYQFEY